MLNYVFIFSIALSFSTFTQEVLAQQIESPDTSMEGEDTLNHFRWYSLDSSYSYIEGLRFTVHAKLSETTKSVDNSSPKNGRYPSFTKFEEYYLKRQVIIYEEFWGEELVRSLDYTHNEFPKECYINEVTPVYGLDTTEIHLKEQKISDRKHSKDELLYKLHRIIIKYDSTPQLNHELTVKYIENHPDSFVLDTIRFKKEFTGVVIPPFKKGTPSYFNEFYFKRVCEYQFGKKHGFEYLYYSPSELNGYVIQNNFMLKTKGHWKNGIKDGIWEEFAPNGKLVKRSKYKNGVLIKSKTFN